MVRSFFPILNSLPFGVEISAQFRTPNPISGFVGNRQTLGTLGHLKNDAPEAIVSKREILRLYLI
jgi:hypothetical protein